MERLSGPVIATVVPYAPSDHFPVLAMVTVPLMCPLVGDVFQDIAGTSSQVGVTWESSDGLKPDQVPLT